MPVTLPHPSLSPGAGPRPHFLTPGQRATPLAHITHVTPLFLIHERGQLYNGSLTPRLPDLAPHFSGQLVLCYLSPLPRPSPPLGSPFSHYSQQE